MKRIGEKLRSEAGASLVLALAVFTLASVLSLSMVSVASASVRVAAMQRDDQQPRLSAVSAARLVQKALQGGTVTYTERDGEAPLWAFTGDGTAGNVMMRTMRELLESGAPVELEITPLDEEWAVNPVKIVFTPEAGGVSAEVKAMDNETAVYTLTLQLIEDQHTEPIKLARLDEESGGYEEEEVGFETTYRWNTGGVA